jgi:nitrate reductase gamma subunit
MKILFAFSAFIILFIIGALASGAPSFFGIILPYAAISIFVLGLTARIIKWERTPVPFKIPTTAGQQKSLDFIRHAKLDNPFTTFQTFLRMFLEIVFFRSLFRNTRLEGIQNGRIIYGDSKILGFFSIIFHYSMLVIVIRHFRFFTGNADFIVNPISALDGFFQIGSPVIYMSTVGICAGLIFLLGRRLFSERIIYISLPSDYFPLFLLLGIAGTGIWIKHFEKIDLLAVKEHMVNLFSFSPNEASGLNPIFLIHLFLVCILLIYFPMSKLVHLGGIFMSPTRNQPNNSRAKRHVNPWNPQVEYHNYEEYEEEFGKFMKAAGLPLEKEYEDGK